MSLPSPQSRRASFLEAAANVVAGLLFALIVQRAVYPVLGIATTFRQDGLIALAFTIASLARSYALRRVFAAIEAHRQRRSEERARSLARRLATGRP